MRQVPTKELLGTTVKKPVLGVGTWLLSNDEAYKSVKTAIRDYGYRQIDTAKMYNNEEGVGRAIKECINEGIVKREDIFITTKLWIDGRDKVEQELKGSMQRLQVDYIDLYIMHFMVPDIKKSTLTVGRTSLMDVWRDMESCQKKGLCRAIGVANCNTVMLLDLLSFCEIKPASNQLELHPYLTLQPVLDFHR